MAEPKHSSRAPISGDESPAPAKKATKKVAGNSKKSSSSSSAAGGDSASAAPAGSSVGSSQLSAASTAAAAVPKLHDVPRIPIAEPKVAPDAASAASGEAKPRTSKKRTAPPPSGPDAAAAGAGPSSLVNRAAASTPMNGSAPTVDATATAKQAAELEREKQATAARREAKRQRAKDLEDAKRREEIAKQAIEDAKRQQEARQREQQRQQASAALNANAEECQEEDEQADYDDDGFENYDDDFEADDKPPEKNASIKPQTKAKAKGSSSSSNASSADALSPAELRKIQQAMQAESKELSTSRPSSSSSSSVTGANASENSQALRADAKKRTSTSIASSIAGLKQSLDPRAKRTKEVLDARRFDIEKANLFHQAPLSAHDAYTNSLRRGLVRQVALSTNDGAKAAATQTKNPASVDKSMHFPDDIGLDSATTTSVGSNNDDSDDRSSAGTHSTARFFKFLESAAYACELLAEGNAIAAEQELETRAAQSTKRRLVVTTSTMLAQRDVFPTKSFDDDAVERLLAGRELVALRFSPCVSNVLVTFYGPREESTNNKENASSNASSLGDKSVGCVWDVNQPHHVLYVLKNESVVSSACLSPSRELVALAGTDDGSIHVWDLRRQPYRSVSKNNNNSSRTNPIAFCSPTYSTCGADYKTVSQHTSTIVALDVIDRTRGNRNSSDRGGGTFQFGSMDDRGIVIIWSLIEFEAGEDALIADKCVEIGGRVKMVMNTLIDMQQQYMQPPLARQSVQRTVSSSSPLTVKPPRDASDRAILTTSARVTPIGPIAAVFKFFLHDPNQFVVGTRTGLVYRGHRFEKTAQSQSRAQYRRRSTMQAVAAVVAIDFHPFTPAYFLVGYEDGSVCLFHCDASVCVSSWEEVPFGVSVSALQWSTARPGVFFVSYSNAQVLVWDLTEQTYAPVFTHTIPALETASPVELASSLYPLALSSETIRTSRPTIALRCGDVPPFQFALLELSSELASRSCDEIRDVELLLASIL